MRTRLALVHVALVMGVLVLAGGAFLAGTGSTRAQSAPSVISTTQQTRFPTNVDFSAVVEAGELLEEAILFYRVLPEGAITRQVAELVLGDVSRLSASVPTGTVSTFIPAGADLEWFWELTTTDGEVIETEREIFRYEDPRYDWMSLEGDNLILYYYEGNEPAAQLLFREGEDAIDQMSELLDITLDFPARIYMWASPSDASGVERTESESFEQEIVTGGTRVLADLVHIFQPTVWVVRHELTHILTKIAGEGGIGNIPSWLDEGVATYAESDWRARRGQALNFAIETDALFNVRSMVSVSNVPGRVDIFYGQAADLVTLLISQFGEEQFAELFAVFKRGSTVDNALLDVYGFDRDGLDGEYRDFLGLEPFVAGEDRSTIIEDDAIDLNPVPTDTEPAGDASPSDDASPSATGAADDGAGQATPPDDEAAPNARSAEEIAAREAEIERRLSIRRPAASFDTGGEFPWEELVTGVGGAALLAGLVLFVLLLRAGGPASPAPTGGESFSEGAFAPPRDSFPPPASEVPPTSSESASDASTLASGPSWPTSTDDDEGWSGWQRRDD